MDDPALNLLIKKPSAWIPIALSLTVLMTMLISFATNGLPTRQADEGAAAHLFQIWLVLEGLMIGYFAIQWLTRKPSQAIWILGLQIAAVLAACAPVYYLQL
jgi:hypothetical protein